MGVDAEKQLREEMLRAAIPQGFRPATCESIDDLLDTVSAEPFADVKLNRILAKLAGREPFRPSQETDRPMPETGDIQELVALHRAKGGHLSPEIQKKIETIKEQIAKSDETGEK